MKIWIDLINTPQVSFWTPFINDFTRDGHQIIITCRDSGNTIALLNQNKFQYTIIGKRVGKSTAQKFLFFPKRIIDLLIFVNRKKPDVAVSQSSFYQPFVARILGIRSIYTNDNEHAKGNQIAFIFAQRVFLPFSLADKKFTKRWPLRLKVEFYPGVKEGIYLSQKPSLVKYSNEGKKTIYFRPEPWSAQYYKGPLNFFDQTLLQLSNTNPIVVLPRDENQIVHYSQKKFEKIVVAKKPITLEEIADTCILFIGAGGSMSRELAVLGIPVISIYQSQALSVDEYLKNKGLIKIKPDITYEEIKTILEERKTTPMDRSIISSGELTYNKITQSILNQKTCKNLKEPSLDSVKWEYPTRP